IGEALSTFEEQLKQKEITCEVQPPKETLYCLTDRVTASYNVLENVLSNAIKFSKSKSKIVIRTYSQKNFVIIEVEDNGIGISKDTLSNLYSEQLTSTKGTQGEVG